MLPNTPIRITLATIIGNPIGIQKGVMALTQINSNREHYNLYYLFAEDQAAHPMPADRAEPLRRLVHDTFVKLSNAAEINPP